MSGLGFSPETRRCGAKRERLSDREPAGFFGAVSEAIDLIGILVLVPRNFDQWRVVSGVDFSGQPLHLEAIREDLPEEHNTVTLVPC